MSKVLKRNVARRDFLKVTGLASGVLLLVACGGSTPTSTQTDAANAEPKPAQPAAANPTPDPDETVVPTADPNKPAPTEEAGTVTLEIGTATGAKEFKYNPDKLEAPAGSKIKLTFRNNTDPKDEVGHNWVLVKTGKEDSVVASGKAAGDDKDWLNTKDLDIITHTKLIEGNQSDKITFNAPPPGVYTFLSTFPDQYTGGMKGTLTIK